MCGGVNGEMLEKWLAQSKVRSCRDRRRLWQTRRQTQGKLVYLHRRRGGPAHLLLGGLDIQVLALCPVLELASQHKDLRQGRSQQMP